MGRKGGTAGRDPWAGPGFFVSVVALLISVGALLISLRAQRFTEGVERDERSLVLKGELISDGERVQLSATDASKDFQEGRAIFPTAVWNEDLEIRASESTLDLVQPRLGLQKLIAKRVAKEKGHGQVKFEAKIPVLIDSRFMTKGQPSHDSSLYVLFLEADVSEEESKPPTVKFGAFFFGNRVPAGRYVTRNNLDQVLEGEGKGGFYIKRRQ